MKRLFPFGIARAWAIVAVTNAAGDVQSNFATHLKGVTRCRFATCGCTRARRPCPARSTSVESIV
jgi:hypothetical protein